MMRSAGRLVAAVSLLLATVGIAQAGTVHGIVKNGTTGKPSPGVELVLVQLQGGMQEVAQTKSDAQGEFTFDNPALGAQPMLVRASYHGINFNTAVPPGSSAVQVDIFEPSKDSKTVTVPSHVVIFQPNGATLIVGEEYQIENNSQPPLAYYRSDGNFDFTLPEKGALQQVAAAGPSGMPVTQLPIDKKNNKYSIAFAFRPGANHVRISYELPYADNAAAVKIPALYPGARLLVAAPPTVQIAGEGLSPAGQEQGMSLYSREDVPAGTLMVLKVSGSAPPPNSGGGGEQAQQGRDAQQGGESAGVSIQAVPGRLDVLKWPLIVGFVVVFGLLGMSLARKQVVAVAGAGAALEAGSVPRPKKSKPEPAHVAAPPAAPASAAAPTNGPASLADVDAAVGTSLDALKEQLFRLELRHQAGTISDAEYAQERAKAQKVLRDLVRG